MPVILCTPFMVPAISDPYFVNVTTLLHFEGVAGASTVIDSSSLHNTITNTSTTLSSATVQVGGTSGSFNGTSSFLSLGTAPGRLGTTDFTIESWVFPLSTASAYPCIFSNYASWFGGNGGLAIFVGHSSGSRTKYQVALNGTFPAIQSTSDIVLGVWVHIAVVRFGNVITLYLNGVANGTFVVATGQQFDGTNNTNVIGTAGDTDTQSQGYLRCYMDEFRITKGVARYTANFTPSTTPFPDV